MIIGGEDGNFKDIFEPTEFSLEEMKDDRVILGDISSLNSFSGKSNPRSL